ncbi:hypothetical protein [Glaciecola petra]|uniref:Uncharacterized protein n=1 Tax=Glaciecola petra TaxID=3075602 RepID=A0ABU2ZWC5_9ALTE|nr:hypothetical protein [Aestuariibacter sp. P117]MDT0596676.1 hypothetical protein [Aestuariibacter sp. P117]
MTKETKRRDLEAQSFMEYAEKLNLDCFHAGKKDGTWLIFGSNGGGKTKMNGKLAKLYISRFYYASEIHDVVECLERGDTRIKLVSCRSHLFSNWYMIEEKMTTVYEEVSDNEI